MAVVVAVAVLCVLRVGAVEEEEEGGANPAGSDQPFWSGSKVSMGGIEVWGRVEVLKGELVALLGTVGMLELMADVVLGIEDDLGVRSTIVEAVAVDVVVTCPGGVSSLTTTYFSFEGREVVFVTNSVTTDSMVFAGSESVMIKVATAVLIKGDSVTPGAVIVTVSSNV